MIQILLVEDDEGDALMTCEALRDSNSANQVHVVRDGASALEFLYKRGDYAQVVTPDLVLLDLNLPRVHGFKVLATVKQDPDLRPIPVVVLTTSEAEEDVRRSYDLHANAYVLKPTDFERLAEVIRAIDEFFAAVARLPHH